MGFKEFRTIFDLRNEYECQDLSGKQPAKYQLLVSGHLALQHSKNYEVMIRDMDSRPKELIHERKTRTRNHYKVCR
jgi:hypothetical protein